MADQNIKITFEVDGIQQTVNSVDELTSALDKAGKSTEDAAKKQGFFAKRADEVKQTLGDLKASFGDLGKGFGIMSKGLTKVASGLGLSTKASKLFGKAASAAIAATGIGLLIPLVISLVNYFTNLEGGAKALKKVMAGLGAIVSNVGKALSLVVKGDFSGAFNTLKDSVVEATEAVDQQFEAEKKLAGLRKTTIIQNAKLNQEIEKQKKILEDTTLSYDERIAALDKVNKATKQLQLNQMEDTKIALQSAEAQLTLTNNYQERRDVETEIAELKASLIDQTTQLQTIEYDAAKVGRELRQQEADELQAARDLKLKQQEDDKKAKEEQDAIDAAAAQKKVDDEIAVRDQLKQMDIADMEEGFAKAQAELDYQEQKTLEDISKLNATEEQKQKIRNSFTQKRKMLAKDEAKYNEDLKKKETDATLSLTANAFGSIAQLAGENSAIGKGAAAAQTAINTYQGASKALAELPPPFSYIAAATTIAGGLLQVKNIMSTKIPGEKGSVSAPSVSNTAIPRIDPSAALDAANENQNIDNEVGIGERANQAAPVKAYVVASDVTSQQEADKKIDDLASL
tara:strand:+ start:5069 stop:6784 length:1716 start_codon:yes stop_codon:yes gene_type:complete